MALPWYRDEFGRDVYSGVSSGYTAVYFRIMQFVENFHALRRRLEHEPSRNPAWGGVCHGFAGMGWRIFEDT